MRYELSSPLIALFSVHMYYFHCELYSPHSDSHGLSLGYELCSPHSDSNGLSLGYELCSPHSDSNGLSLGYELCSPHSDSHCFSLGYELYSPHSDSHGLAVGYELCSPQWLGWVTGHLSMNCPRLSDAYCSHYNITLTQVWMTFASVRFTCTYSRWARNCAHLTVTHMAMVLVDVPYPHRRGNDHRPRLMVPSVNLGGLSFLLSAWYSNYSLDPPSAELSGCLHLCLSSGLYPTGESTVGPSHYLLY